MPDTQIQKPIVFAVPETIDTRHASHLVVQPLPDRFILSFFECLPPLVLGNTEDEKRQAWDKVSSIPATCVARIVIAESDMAGFLQVMQQQQEMAKRQAMQGFKAFA